MEFKGTKGKWYIDLEESGRNEFSQLCTAVSSVSKRGAKTIGIAEIFGEDKESEANAKLIASAPEMFEMLKEFIQDFDKGLIEDYQIPRDRFEKLLTKITE